MRSWVRDRLPPRLLLHVLLEPGVQIPDHGAEPTTRSPERSTTSRSTPCVDGWFGPKLTWRTSLRVHEVDRNLERGRDRAGCASRCRSFRLGDRHHRLRRTDRLAAERVVLTERMPFPVVFHQDPAEVRVAVEGDAHHVVGLALVPVGGRPDLDHAGHALTVLEPELDADDVRTRNRQQVVVEREAGGLRVRPAREAL